MWIKFTEAFLWTPKTDRRWSIQYTSTGGAQGRYNVTRACADAAIAAGVATKCKPPRRDGDTGAEPEASADDEVAEQGQSAAPASEAPSQS